MLSTYQYFTSFNFLIFSIGSLFCCKPLLAADHYVAHPDIYHAVRQAQQALDQQRYQSALQTLQQQLPHASTPYEQALLQQNIGVAQLQQGQVAVAVKAFAKALKLKALPPKEQLQLQRIQAQGLIQTGKITQGLAVLRRWRKQAKALKVADHQLFAYAYTQLKQPAKAAWHVQKAIQKTAQPPIAWYQQLLNHHMQAQQWAKAIKVLHQLLNQQPQNTRYWQQLVRLYLQQDQKEQALAALRLAQRQGVMDADLLYLSAHLALQQGQPLTAVRLLEQAFARQPSVKTEKMQHLWDLAREHARERHTVPQNDDKH